jgi:hypothetical protein
MIVARVIPQSCGIKAGKDQEGASPELLEIAFGPVQQAPGRPSLISMNARRKVVGGGLIAALRAFQIQDFFTSDLC